MSDTSDSERLRKRQQEAQWTEVEFAAYVKARDAAALSRIYDKRKPREPKIERGPGVHGWLRQSYDPHSAWRSPRKRGDF